MLMYSAGGRRQPKALHAREQHLIEELLRDRQQRQHHCPLRVCDGCLDSWRRDGIQKLQVVKSISHTWCACKSVARLTMLLLAMPLLVPCHIVLVGSAWSHAEMVPSHWAAQHTGCTIGSPGSWPLGRPVDTGRRAQGWPAEQQQHISCQARHPRSGTKSIRQQRCHLTHQQLAHDHAAEHAKCYHKVRQLQCSATSQNMRVQQMLSPASGCNVALRPRRTAQHRSH